MSRSKMIMLFIILLLALLTVTAEASVDAAAGRSVLERVRNALVRVQVNYQMEMEGEKSEDKSETMGIVIDPSGLTVLSLASTGLNNFDGDTSVNVKVTAVKVRQQDGVEVPYKIAVRDKDLDLVFVTPAKAPAVPLKYVDIAKGAAADLLDEVFFVSRMGKVAGYAPSLVTGRIIAVIEKPRRYFVPDLLCYSAEMGAAVFNIRGEIVGFLLTRTLEGEASEFSLAMADELAVILPAESVRKTAEQAEGSRP